jgi:7,8-dihydroneopterin aldolase/epimerase/oxygenase
VVTVHLHEIIVFAKHGIYDHEKISGSKFEVNLDVSFDSKKSEFAAIADTVDYEVLNNIVNECMVVPTPLLERVCSGIIKRIKKYYSFVVEINISIFKLQPPIKDFHGKAGVSMNRKW